MGHAVSDGRNITSGTIHTSMHTPTSAAWLISLVAMLPCHNRIGQSLPCVTSLSQLLTLTLVERSPFLSFSHPHPPLPLDPATPQAEELIKRRLEVTPGEPRLWCALGDLCLDDAHYLQAWECSGHRNARCVAGGQGTLPAPTGLLGRVLRERWPNRVAGQPACLIFSLHQPHHICASLSAGPSAPWPATPCATAAIQRRRRIGSWRWR